MDFKLFFTYARGHFHCGYTLCVLNDRLWSRCISQWPLFVAFWKISMMTLPRFLMHPCKQAQWPKIFPILQIYLNPLFLRGFPDSWNFTEAHSVTVNMKSPPGSINRTRNPLCNHVIGFDQWTGIHVWHNLMHCVYTVLPLTIKFLWVFFYIH